MRKINTLLLVAALLVTASGCGQQAGETPEVTTAVARETTEAPERETTAAEITTDAPEATQTAAAETTGEDTVTEEVYEPGAEGTTVNEEEVSEVPVVSAIDDPAFEEAMLKFLEPIYYNIFFGHGDYVDGIAEEDMVKFAISYIYQHEYNELKFDTQQFILYVPEKRVETLVKKYFDKSVSGHHSFVEENVLYEDGYYLMPAVDTGWNDTISIAKVSAAGDYSYEVILKVTSENSEKVTQYRVAIEMRDDHYVLTGYTHVVEAVEETETEAATTAA